MKRSVSWDITSWVHCKPNKLRLLPAWSKRFLAWLIHRAITRRRHIPPNSMLSFNRRKKIELLENIWFCEVAPLLRLWTMSLGIRHKTPLTNALRFPVPLKDLLHKRGWNSSLVSYIKNCPLYRWNSGVAQMVSYSQRGTRPRYGFHFIWTLKFVLLSFSKNLWRHILFHFTALLVTDREMFSAHMFQLQVIISRNIFISDFSHLDIPLK
jgi:hypothetical protein